ncbi:hypothetical protein ABL978_19550, partial [Pseudomonas aeruginosa]
MCASLTRLFDGRAMGRALAVSLPLFVLYSASGDANWLLANIATISVAVVVERVGGAPLAALGQGVAIILGFLGLSFALAWGAAFAIACAALAAAAVALSGLDTRLRTLGNFVFIFHRKVKTTGFQPVSFSATMRGWRASAWITDTAVIRSTRSS